MSNLWSNQNNVERNKDKIRLCLMKWAYPKKLIYSVMSKVKFITRHTNEKKNKIRSVFSKEMLFFR